MSTLTESNQAAYEKPAVVTKYEVSHLQNAEALALVAFADDFRQKSVLDIGCGAGRTSFFLLQFTDEYVGIDYSRNMIEACRRRFPAGDFQEGDVRDLSRFAAGSFDTVVFSFNGIDSISHEDRLKSLNEIKRVLRLGGLFLFSAHNRDCVSRHLSPRLVLCMNPSRLIKNVRTWIRQYKNRRARKPLETWAEEYEIINDRDLDYAMLHYYISVGSQVAQLSRAGFEIDRIWDSDGFPLAVGGRTSTATWIYYVCRKS